MSYLSQKTIYLWVFFGTCLSALGPSFFMKMLKDYPMNRELGVGFFLLFGGLSTIFVYLIDTFKNSKDKKKIVLNTHMNCKLLVCGVLTAAQFLAFTIAMQLGSVTETTMMVRVSPIMSLLMGHFFLNEKVENWKLAMFASVLCLGSVLFMQDLSMNFLQSTQILPILLGILSAFALAAKSTLSSSLTAKHHNLPNLLVVSSTMILGGLLMFFWVDKNSFSFPDMSQLGILVFLGVGTVAIPAAINIHAFRVTGNMGAVTYFGFLLPVLGAVAAYFIYGERGFDYLRLGLAFVIMSIGIVIMNWKPKPKK